jgi:hypothetical protein
MKRRKLKSLCARGEQTVRNPPLQACGPIGSQ